MAIKSYKDVNNQVEEAKTEAASTQTSAHSFFVQKLKDNNYYPKISSKNVAKREELKKKLNTVDKISLNSPEDIENESCYSAARRPGLNIGRLVNFGQAFSNFGSTA
jgi:hypothetical protein